MQAVLTKRPNNSWLKKSSFLTKNKKEKQPQKLTSVATLNTMEDTRTRAGLANSKRGFLFLLCHIRSTGKSPDLSEPQVLHLDNGF